MEESDSRIPASSSTMRMCGLGGIVSGEGNVSAKGQSAQNCEFANASRPCAYWMRFGPHPRLRTAAGRSGPLGRRSGQDLGRGQLENEAGTDRGVVLDAEAAAVFGDDAGGDGQPESGAAVLGREVRKEELVLVLWGNAVAGVGDNDFYKVGLGLGTGRDGDVANGGGFQSFGGVVNQVDDHRSDELRVGPDGGRLQGEGSVEGDAVEAVRKDLDRFTDDGVDVGGFELRRREAH